MDNTELHYIQCDPEKIWNDMILEYVNAGGDILYPGDEKEMLLRSVQADIIQVLMGVDNALRMMTLQEATGKYLDILGENRNCNRIEASAATATVSIQTNITGKNQVLSAGTAMTGDGEVYYLLTEDVTLTGYQQDITAQIIADRTGSIGNGLSSGTELSLAIANESINKIIVTAGASGGNEEEEDEPYRKRIRDYGLVSVTTGPEQQYEAAAEDVSSYIVDAKALNIGPGKVGIYLILSAGTGKDLILQAVQKKLSNKDTRPLTDQVTVSEAEAVPYTLVVHYLCDNSGSTVKAITQALESYQAWQDNTIGRPFNPDRLMAAMYQAGATRVIWGAECRFDGSSNITYTEIQENKHCKGKITLIASTS